MSVATTFASFGGVITDVVVGPATHSSIGGRGKAHRSTPSVTPGVTQRPRSSKDEGECNASDTCRRDAGRRTGTPSFGIGAGSDPGPSVSRPVLGELFHQIGEEPFGVPNAFLLEQCDGRG
jgi:hypothetical protein